MNKGRGQLPTEKPVIIVRRKAGTKRFPSDPAQPPPRILAPTTQTEAPAPSPPPSIKPQQPLPVQTPAAPVVTGPGPSKKAQEKQARRELLEVFRERWPQAFPHDYRQVRPLAVGIHRDLAVYLPGHSHRQIGAVLSLFKYLVNPAYLRAILRGGPRYDLEGNPRGEVTAQEQEQARQELHAFYERRKKNALPRAHPPHEDTASAGGDKNKK